MDLVVSKLRRRSHTTNTVETSVSSSSSDDGSSASSSPVISRKSEDTSVISDILLELDRERIRRGELEFTVKQMLSREALLDEVEKKASIELESLLSSMPPLIDNEEETPSTSTQAQAEEQAEAQSQEIANLLAKLETNEEKARDYDRVVLENTRLKAEVLQLRNDNTIMNSQSYNNNGNSSSKSTSSSFMRRMSIPLPFNSSGRKKDVDGVLGLIDVDVDLTTEL